MSRELATRLWFFFATLALMAAWELVAPKRSLSASRPWRWLNNLGLQASDTILLLLAQTLVPTLAMGMSVLAERNRWGLLNQVRWHLGLKVLIAFVFLDLVIYAQHRTFHAVPAFWRLHKVHHTDLDVDVTTGVRFHPAEIVLSLLIKTAAVALSGAHFLAVLVFEVVLNATSLFNHSNVRVPEGLERLLRLVLVTPDMHRVHHSVVAGETNSNYGFNLPWWDRLLGTYNDQPAQGHEDMSLGLPEYRDWRAQSLPWLLSLPLR